MISPQNRRITHKMISDSETARNKQRRNFLRTPEANRADKQESAAVNIRGRECCCRLTMDNTFQIMIVGPS